MWTWRFAMAFIPKDARWYLADVVLEHQVEGDPRNVVHVNMHLIEAASPENAYEKVVALGRDSELVYANTSGVQVRVIFRRLRNLNVIHDELEDGAELTYEEKVSVPEAEIASWLCPRDKLGIFTDREFKNEVPNYMPQEVMRSLVEEGFTPSSIERET